MNSQFFPRAHIFTAATHQRAQPALECADLAALFCGRDLARPRVGAYIPHIDGPISVRTLFASACSLIACYGDVQELQDLPVKGR